MKKIIAIAALTCLFTGSAFAEATIGAETSHPGSGLATTHSASFDVNARYEPLAFVDVATNAGSLSDVKATEKAVVLTSQFNYKTGHTYILSGVTSSGANAGKLDVGFAINKNVPAGLTQKTSLQGGAAAGSAYVLVASKGTGTLAEGSTVVNFTVTDYAS
ncbi:hypothetical protein GJ842_21515 [Salmonella enterica]|nr:hypothetical protein [Salmonella enterica]